MANDMPDGFTSIAEAQRCRNFSQYNIVGVCTDYLPPAQSRGTDMCMKLTLWDTSCIGAEDLGQDGMAVRLFCKEHRQFPPVQNNGDAVILRNIKTKHIGSQWLGLSSINTKWVVISGTSITDDTDDSFSNVEYREAPGDSTVQPAQRGPNPTLAELKYIKQLLLANDPSTLRGPPRSTALDVYTIMKDNGGQPAPLRLQKLKTLAQLQSPDECKTNQFVDLVGELCKVFDNNQNLVDVKITDYTEHPLLFDYTNGGRSGSGVTDWSGPSGRMTITVNVWGEHAAYIRKLSHEDGVKEGMYVRLRNVQIKMSKSGIMEGYLRDGGNNFGNSISLYTPREARDEKVFEELLARRRQCGLEDRAQFLGLKDQEKVPQKRHIDAEDPVKANETAALSRRQKKRAKLKANKAKNMPDGGEGQSTTNHHVRCEGMEVPLTTISSILEAAFLNRKTPTGNSLRLPFQNCKYKSKVKVIDYFPDNLEDFAVPFKSDYEQLSDDEVDYDEEVSLAYARENKDFVRWEWHFFLLVEDADNEKDASTNTEVLLLQVADKDGDYLFNAEACDLRKNPTELAKLRQSLFVLWGDLEEKRTEHHATGTQLRNHGHTVSSRPFECFIREYGVNARNEKGEKCAGEFERMFSMLGTRIC